MKTVKVIGVLVLIFVAGFSGGVVATRVVVREMVKEARRNPETPQVLRTNIEQNLYRTLQLTPEQRKQVREILKDSRDRRRPLLEQFQPQLDAITLETRSNITAKLRPEQQERFKQFLSENRQFLFVRELPPKRAPSSNTNSPR
jgi:uncharacterized membrane protein